TNNPTATNNGMENTAVGDYALQFNSTGNANVAVGYTALNSNTTGLGNTALGFGTLANNSTGGQNVAIGENALASNTATGNISIGYNSMLNTTSGNQNTAVGYTALENNATGQGNTALGYQTMVNNTSNFNVAIGAQALQFNTACQPNIAVGFGALNSQSFGTAMSSDNVAVGYLCLTQNNPTLTSNGQENSGFGDYSMYSNTTGSYNTGLGYYALYSNTTGTYNTALGYDAGPNSGALTNTIAIGNSALVTTNNSAEFGNLSITFLGINGAPWTANEAIRVGTSASNGNGAFLTIGGVWTNASDRNKKENFTVLDPNAVLNKIKALPVTRWNYKGEASSIQHIGPMAQDFYKLFHVGSDSLSISTIDPAGIALIGVKALAAKNDSLSTKNKELQKLNSTLKTQVDNLKASGVKGNVDERLSNDEKEIAELKKLINNMMQVQASAKQ